MRNRMINALTVYRQGTAADLAAIRAVEERAFGRRDEADLSAALIGEAVETLSLVAANDAAGIVGHVLFSRLDGPERALALAPLSVDPDFQEMQIGTELVRAGLALARMEGWRSVFVLGHPDYYRRFGFRSELADGAEIVWQGPRFLALELADGALAGWRGPLSYAAPFRRFA